MEDKKYILEKIDDNGNLVKTDVYPFLKDKYGHEILLIEYPLTSKKEKQDFDFYMEFIVYEVSSWGVNDSIPNMHNLEVYVQGTIKWDGCSHLNFGTEDHKGYLHLCGKLFFDNHVNLINKLWETAKSKIKNWDDDVAS